MTRTGGFAALIAGRAARAYRARPSNAKATGKPVIGIDASPAMLAQARARASGRDARAVLAHHKA